MVTEEASHSFSSKGVDMGNIAPNMKADDTPPPRKAEDRAKERNKQVVDKWIMNNNSKH